MKSISLKLKDPIFADMERVLQALKENRNAYINNALAAYNKQQKRQLIAEQFRVESALVAADSMEILADFEQLSDEL
jgi:hypothetical protein